MKKKYYINKNGKTIYELWDSKKSNYKYITCIDATTKKAYVTFEFKSEKERQEEIDKCLKEGTIKEYEGGE